MIMSIVAYQQRRLWYWLVVIVWIQQQLLVCWIPLSSARRISSKRDLRRDNHDDNDDDNKDDTVPTRRNQQQQHHQRRRRVSSSTILREHVLRGNRLLEDSSTSSSSSHNATIRSLLFNPPSSPDEHLVTKLPLLESDFPTQHWAGLLPASEEPGNYFFYWLFEPDFSQVSPEQQGTIVPPLVIWLNGGPGCSSMDGLFLENGPFQFVPSASSSSSSSSSSSTDTSSSSSSWKLQRSTTSWHLAPAYMLYIDQPVGTGLSFTTTNQYPTNDEQVNQHFYYFLLQFFQLHAGKFLTPLSTEPTATVDESQEQQQEWIVNRPFYLTGESHAGHYIPSMMAYIIQHNHIQRDSLITIPFHGAAIGNGWIDPRYQYAAAQAAYGHGLIDQFQWTSFNILEQQCQQELQMGHYNVNICRHLLNDIVHQSSGVDGDYIISQYDTRRWETKSGPRQFPPGYQVVEHYLGGWTNRGNKGLWDNFNYQTVLEALHATPSHEIGQQRFVECSNPPFDALFHQDGKGVVDEIIQMLEYNNNNNNNNEKAQKIRLLFYNGVYDLICNHVGNEVLLEKLTWSHQQDYRSAPRFAWTAPSKLQQGGRFNTVSAYVKEYDNLTYLKVMDSGHMVPMDVPDVALDMIRTFLYHGSFQQSIQHLEQDTTDSSLRGVACT